MTEGKIVSVHWHDCDCEWVTKYCDDHHLRYARLPVSELAKWEVKR